MPKFIWFCTFLLVSIVSLAFAEERRFPDGGFQVPGPLKEPLTCSNSSVQNLPNYHPPLFNDVSLSVDIPPDRAVRVYYYRARGEASWVDYCAVDPEKPGQTFSFGRTSTIQNKVVRFDGYELSSGCGKGITVTQIANRLTAGLAGDVFSGVTRAPYNGEFKGVPGSGTVFGWYDGAGPQEPNTLVFVLTAPQVYPCK